MGRKKNEVVPNEGTVPNETGTGTIGSIKLNPDHNFESQTFEAPPEANQQFDKKGLNDPL